MGVTNRRDLKAEDHRDHLARTVVMHFPLLCKLHKCSNSDLNVELASMRAAASTPTVKRSLENVENETENEMFSGSRQMIAHQKQTIQKSALKKQKTCLPLERPSPFVATNVEIPIIDISEFDYDAYRHKLIETSLKRQYGDRQAPGDVVLNSIHLNTIGSQAGIELSATYSHSLFDFIEEYYDASTQLSKKEKEYLHPLDHFLTKGLARPSTAERCTETKESTTELDQLPELIDFHDQPSNANNLLNNIDRRRVLEESAKNPSKITIRSRRSTSLPRSSSRTSTAAGRPNLVPSGRKSSTSPLTQQLYNREDHINFNKNGQSRVSLVIPDKFTDRKAVDASISRPSRSRTSRSIDHKVSQNSRFPETTRKRAPSAAHGKSSTESFTPGTDRDEKESGTCVSATSSEAASSCSSKPRDKPPVRSRASSLSSKSRTIAKATGQTREWYIGSNPKASFNKRYAETHKDSTSKINKQKSTVRPKSTGGTFDWDVPETPGQNWCNDKTIHSNSRQPAVSTLGERPKTVNPAGEDRRKSPTNGKSSDTVLPVLESVVDFEVEMAWDNPNDCTINTNPSSDRSRRIPYPGPRDIKRAARSRDTKISSSSFVKAPVTGRAPEIEGAADKASADRSNDRRDRSVESGSKVIGKSSSGLKSTAKPPGSTSKLPIHVGTDKSVIKKVSQELKGTESRESRSKHSNKIPGPVERNPPGSSVRKPRPRTAGCLQNHTSSLSPKIELSLENLQPAKPSVDVPIATGKGDKQLHKKIVGQDSSKIPSRSLSTGSKKFNPSSRTSFNKTVKPSSPLSDYETDTSNTNFVQEGSGKKPFLRARTGKYGAPKLNAAHHNKKAPDSSSTSKQTIKNNEESEEIELLKLPTEGSKAALVMRRELKTYIKKIKLILTTRDKSLQAKDLASLSITEAVIPELRSHLSPREVHELQSLLDRVENTSTFH